MGGMAAQIPIRDDFNANEEAMQRVREDKLREVRVGHDGTWAAHPALVPIAMSVFDEHMPQENQIRQPAEPRSPITAADLLEVPSGRITEAGLRRNIDVGLRYIESWLRGNGCVPIYNLMEDAATAEICRAQIWQWIRYGACLENGRAITAELHDQLLREVLDGLRSSMTSQAYSASKFECAAEFVRKLSREIFRSF